MKKLEGGVPRKMAILHNLRSVYNTASIFRTADALGLNHIFLSGTTPAPIDRFGRPRSDFAKVSLGAEKTVPWSYHARLHGIIYKLKKGKVEIVSLELGVLSVDYKLFRPKGDVALIVGDETLGVPANIQKLSDAVIQIPMKGKKESLNVAVAFGVAAYRIFDRR